MIIAILAALAAIIVIVYVERRHDADFESRLRAMEDEHRKLIYGDEPK